MSEPIEDDFEASAGGVAKAAPAGETSDGFEGDSAIARAIEESLTGLEAMVERACTALLGAGSSPSTLLSMRWRGNGARAYLPQSSWGLIRQFYVRERLPAGAIAAFFGISAAAVWQRAKRERWRDSYEIKHMDSADGIALDAATYATLLTIVANADGSAGLAGPLPNRTGRQKVAAREGAQGAE